MTAAPGPRRAGFVLGNWGALVSGRGGVVVCLLGGPQGQPVGGSLGRSQGVTGHRNSFRGLEPRTSPGVRVSITPGSKKPRTLPGGKNPELHQEVRAEL